ncbi:MAG: LrgB family protein [Spirochaetales bacterium]
MIFLVITLITYALALTFQQKLSRNVKTLSWIPSLFHPVLVSVLGISLILTLSNTPYEVYKQGTEGLSFLLAPSVVALAVPLYKEWKRLQKEMGAILVTLTFGSWVGIISSVAPALLFSTPLEVVASLAPRSVTTPIAMDIAASWGGLASLTAAVVVSTGIVGALLGPILLQLFHWIEEAAFGLAMGVASHGIGTARALEISEKAGAYSALALGLNGILTSIWVPLLIQWL